MFKLFGWILKAALFSGVVLIAAHYITWDGKTVSDQVGSSLSSAEKSAPLKTIRKKSRALIRSAKETASHVGVSAAKRAEETSGKLDEKIPADDREKLQALIHSSDSG
jgi:hypothetical protein